MVPSEFASRCTTRLITTGNKKGYGTGFFFKFESKKEQRIVIITNKHVFHDAAELELTFNIHDGSGAIISGAHKTVSIEDFTQIDHPSAEVDLTAIGFAKAIDLLEEEGHRPTISAIAEENIFPFADKDKCDELGHNEQATMVGYPNNLWDETNNLPIFRTGTTATKPDIDYNGRTDFLIDMAALPGSSGSPIIQLNDGSYFQRGKLHGGPRFKLLGILKTGYYVDLFGKIKAREAPTSNSPKWLYRRMLHLGVCLRADRILDLKASVMKTEDSNFHTRPANSN